MQTVVQEEKALLDILAQLSPDSSKNTLRSWIEKGRVTIDGRSVSQAKATVTCGQKVEVAGRSPFLERGIKILYEDRHLVVIDKPEGLLSVATDFDRALTAHAILKKRFHTQKVYPVHRLDRETSGVMVFTYTETAKEHLKVQFKDHSIDRIYTAIVVGKLTPLTGTWTSNLVEDANYHVKSSEEGRKSTTHYEVIGYRKNLTLAKFTLETGRKNQIRVHCSEAGYPILGDEKYGSKNKKIPRLFLHAHTLSFTHPITKKRLSFESPLPAAFHP